MSDNFIGTDTDKVEVYSKIKKLDKKYGKVATIEVKKRDPYIPPSLQKKLRENLVKVRSITANDIALKNDIRVSAAKRLLKKLEAEGLVKLVTSTSRLKIYRGAEAK